MSVFRWWGGVGGGKKKEKRRRRKKVSFFFSFSLFRPRSLALFLSSSSSQKQNKRPHLHNPDHGLIRLWRDNVPGNSHDRHRFRPRLQSLRNVHVHLVAIEIGVVRARDAQVEAERRVRQDAHAVAHHRHLVQRGLPVEEHDVAVLEVALNAEAVLEVAVGVAADEAEVEALAVLADDESEDLRGVFFLRFE